MKFVKDESVERALDVIAAVRKAGGAVSSIKAVKLNSGAVVAVLDLPVLPDHVVQLAARDGWRRQAVADAALKKTLDAARPAPGVDAQAAPSGAKSLGDNQGRLWPL